MNSTAPITPFLAPDLLRAVLKTKRVPMLHGSPGISKSAIVKQLAKDFDLELVDIRLSQADPTDLNGFPVTLPSGKAGYMPFETFPVEGDKLPEGKKGWLIFLDEINSAALSIQKAAYKLILDRMVGNNHLHENAYGVAAGNLATDGAIVNRLSTALQSRMVHFELEVSAPDWLKWAEDNAIDYRIIAYIRWKEDELFTFDPKHDDYTFACPRTWEFLSDLIKPMEKIPYTFMPAVIGTISDASGRQFMTFTEIFDQIPSMDEISRDPLGTRVPEDSSVMYAITASIGKHVNTSNIAPVMQYLDRLPMEFQVISMQAAMKTDSGLLKEAPVKQWLTKNAKELL